MNPNRPENIASNPDPSSAPTKDTPIADMRRTYDAATLLETDIADDPLVQFDRWFEAAAAVEVPDWLEINAMTLSTADRNGPTSRVVLLKDRRATEAGPVWTFYSNYESQKAAQIATQSTVTLNFYWPHTQQQIRITGTAQKNDRQTTRDYFHSRPRESQLGAIASNQSMVIPNRQTLQTRWDDLRRRYEDKEIPCPENWGGYDVTGREIEFWQGRPGRLHDRLRYHRRSDDTAWTIERLAP